MTFDFSNSNLSLRITTQPRKAFASGAVIHLIVSLLLSTNVLKRNSTSLSSKSTNRPR